MLKFVLPAIIFLSLGIIIFILAKRLPDFKKVNGIKKNGGKTSSEITEERHKNKIKGFFGIFFAKIGKFFVFIAEELVKRLKKLLHLIHFWLIKLKRKKTSENKIQEELDAKEELVEVEEKNLENVINVNLRQPEEIDLKDEQKEKADQQEIKLAMEEDSKDVVLDNHQEQEMKKENKKREEIDGKVEGFFREDDSLIKEEVILEKEEIEGDLVEEETKKEKKGFFGKIANKFKRKKREDFEEEIENEKQGDFSDGIVKVEQYEKPEVKEDLLMKEVVAVRKKDSDLDEELGVDRKILERKILQKITQNPRAAENYRQLGELYIKMKNYSEAQECYKQILKIQVRDIDANKKLEKIKLLKRLRTE